MEADRLESKETPENSQPKEASNVMRSYEELELKLDHPPLPDWITMVPKVKKFRPHPINEALERASANKVNEKKLRCKQFSQSSAGNIPVSFTENTNKERLVLEHVKKYEEQFHIAYKNEGGDRQLFLYPPNECGVEKFISTTIRPTKMGYLEFYDVNKCAEYVSNFVTYETLENPLKFPEVIPSPTSVIEWQKGDCFDMSILLCSLLIGVGYDAYCVIGNAPYEITLKNEGLMSNPYLDIGLKDVEFKKIEIPPITNENYPLEPKQPRESKYDQELEENKRAAAEMAELQENNILDDDEPDRLPPDEFEGERVHCWILVKQGTRGIEKNLFIEPSTGRVWEIEKDDHPYFTVDQIFNNKNYWINLDIEKPISQIRFQNMNNAEKSDWEYVMIDTVEFPTLDNLDEDEEEFKPVQSAVSGGIGVGS